MSYGNTLFLYEKYVIHSFLRVKKIIIIAMLYKKGKVAMLLEPLCQPKNNDRFP